MDDESLRLELQALLETTFPEWTVVHRPSGNTLFRYPYIRYEPKALDPTYAGSGVYSMSIEYEIMFLSLLSDRMSSRAMFDLVSPGFTIRSNRTYEVEDIVHDVYIVVLNSIA